VVLCDTNTAIVTRPEDALHDRRESTTSLHQAPKSSNILLL
jgi:hypothetical protein